MSSPPKCSPCWRPIDCNSMRYALQVAADRCPMARPMVFEARVDEGELAELRAYKERTEAALRKLTLMPGKRRWVEESLKALGLWRDKEPAKLVVTYMGKPLAECSREELLAARDGLFRVSLVGGPNGKRLTLIEQDEARAEMLREIDALLAKHKETP